MGIFADIMNKIFGSSPAPTAGGPSMASATPIPGVARPAPTAGMAVAPAGKATVDVAAVLTAMAAQNSQKLDWRKSIVDMMKLLGLDSGLSSRKELAKELGYTGDTNDSATMNIWLHKQVMQKLASNGGKVPDELK